MSLPALLRFETHEIRLIEIDGAPWWVLSDVCAVLEIDNPWNVATRLDDDEKGLHSMDTLGGPQELTIVSEPGLYKLLMTSRKPVAKRFDRWVRHEVLPEIRRTGGYGNNQVPAVAEQIIVGLKEALRPLAVRFDGQDQAIERIERRQDVFAEDMASVKAHLLNGRRRLKEATKREHINAVRALGGRCPCCGEAQVVDSDGVKSRFSEYDHFYQSSYPNAEHTWLICAPCHNGLSAGRIPRDQREAEFRAYQNKRRRLPDSQGVLF